MVVRALVIMVVIGSRVGRLCIPSSNTDIVGDDFINVPFRIENGGIIFVVLIKKLHEPRVATLCVI